MTSRNGAGRSYASPTEAGQSCSSFFGQKTPAFQHKAVNIQKQTKPAAEESHCICCKGLLPGPGSVQGRRQESYEERLQVEIITYTLVLGVINLRTEPKYRVQSFPFHQILYLSSRKAIAEQA